LVSALSFVVLVFSGCATSPSFSQAGAHSDAYAKTGFYLDRDAVSTRGDVGNYLTRPCTGRWGFPVADCSEMAAPKSAQVAAPAPVLAPVANPLSTTAAAKTGIRLDLEFKTNSAELAKSEDAQLEKIAAALKSNPNVKIRVEGHSDNSGLAAMNQALSERRAAMVRSFLIDKGVKASQVTAKGYGASQPIAPNTNQSGRAKNRRVMVVVTSK
jgi:outer membrane protein OmpA-like peptidoglycan-associated protein